MNNKIGLGTAAIGRPTYINLKRETEKDKTFSLVAFRQEGMAVLNTAYDQGVRYFDTAPGYGMAEQMLIDWVMKKEDAAIEVATKWGYTYVADFNLNATEHEVKEHSLQKLNEQWEQSKQLLPHLRVYQIHSATFETGVLKNEAILNRLAELKEQHNLLIGLTTTGANQVEVLKEAIEIELDGKQLFDVFQVTYNIFDQSLAEIADKFSNQNKKLVIKEALANGRIFPNDKYPNYATTYRLLSRLVEKYKVGIDAIALRFCVDSVSIDKVLSGASNEQHLSDNLRAQDFRLEEKDITALKKLAISPAQYWQERKQLNWN